MTHSPITFKRELRKSYPTQSEVMTLDKVAVVRAVTFAVDVTLGRPSDDFGMVAMSASADLRGNLTCFIIYTCAYALFDTRAIAGAGVGH